MQDSAPLSNVADAQRHEVTASEFAVNGEIEQGEISWSPSKLILKSAIGRLIEARRGNPTASILTQMRGSDSVIPPESGTQ